MNVLILTVIVTLLLTILYVRYWKLTYWKRRGVEQIENINYIFGNFKDAVLFRTAPGWHLGQLYRAAKSELPYVGFYIFHKPCLLLRDPDMIKQVLVRDFANFCDRHFAGSAQKDSFGMKNLFGLNNPAWKYLRNKISPTLNRGKLRKMLLSDTGVAMMDHLKQQNCIENGYAKIDVQELNFKYTTDVIANVALGTQLNSFANPSNPFSKNSKLLHNF